MKEQTTEARRYGVLLSVVARTKKSSVIPCLSGLLFFVFSAPSSAEIINRVLAVVAGELITLSDVRGAIDLGLVDLGGAADPIAAALHELIQRELVLDEVERYAPPEPEAAAIDRGVDVVRQRFAARPEQLRQTMTAAGISDAALRRWVTDDLRIEAYLGQRFGAAVQPTPEEVAEYYRRHRDAFVLGGRRLTIDEAEPVARNALAAEWRRALIADWTAGLWRRAEIMMYLPDK
jgi:hypothetical protein